MVAQICGMDLGVAKEVWPVLYTWEANDDKHWLLDVLDNIYTDFLRTNLASPDTARLAVLNMSFGMLYGEDDWNKKIRKY